MKKTAISLFIAICLVSFISASAFAGDKQRHRWEGVAIGVGAAVLGHAILNDYRGRDEAPARPAMVRKDRHSRSNEMPQYKKNRGKARKVWIPPVCERVWNPGHYSRHGDWVCGQWITIETQSGYWAKKKNRRACR